MGNFSFSVTPRETGYCVRIHNYSFCMTTEDTKALVCKLLKATADDEAFSDLQPAKQSTPQ